MIATTSPLRTWSPASTRRSVRVPAAGALSVAAARAVTEPGASTISLTVPVVAEPTVTPLSWLSQEDAESETRVTMPSARTPGRSRARADPGTRDPREDEGASRSTDATLCRPAGRTADTSRDKGPDAVFAP